MGGVLAWVTSVACMREWRACVASVLTWVTWLTC